MKPLYDLKHEQPTARMTVGELCEKYLQATKNENRLHSGGFTVLVGVEGFEPPASWSQTTRATKLRQTPKNTYILYRFFICFSIAVIYKY